MLTIPGAVESSSPLKSHRADLDFFFFSPHPASLPAVARLEEWYASAYRHRHSLPDPGQLLRPLHLRHHLHGRVEEGLGRHGGAPHHHAGPHLLLLRLQVLFILTVQRGELMCGTTVVLKKRPHTKPHTVVFIF